MVLLEHDLVIRFLKICIEKLIQVVIILLTLLTWFCLHLISRITYGIVIVEYFITFMFS